VVLRTVAGDRPIARSLLFLQPEDRATDNVGGPRQSRLGLSRELFKMHDLLTRIATRGALLILSILLYGCDEGKNSSQGDEDLPGSKGSSANSGCKAGEPLFPAQKFDEFDLIRSVLVDSATQDIYFSIADQIYLAQDGGFTPFTGRSAGGIFGDSEFWIVDGAMLIPGGSGLLDTLGVIQSEVVLSSVSLAGGDVRAIVTLPTPGDGERFSIEDVAILGDEVLWITAEGVTDEVGYLPEYEETYVVRKANWRSPSESVELYRTALSLNNLIVTEGRAFAGSKNIVGGVSGQVVLSLKDATVEGRSVEVFGGQILGADSQTLLVEKSGPDNDGLFLTTPDGSVIKEVFPYQVGLASDGNGRWALVRPPLGFPEEPAYITIVGPNGEERDVGCFDDSLTVHALAFAGDDLLVATYEDSGSTIRRLSLGE